MLPPDAFLKLFAALTALAFAAIVAKTPARRAAANGYLAVFLLLIAANQGAEAMRSLATEPTEQLRWFRLASIAASLDPAALLLFAASHHGRTVLRPPMLAAVLAPAGLLALMAGWMLAAPQGQLSAHAFHLALSLYTASAYSMVFVWTLRRFVAEPQERAWPPVLAAVGLVALASLPRVVEHVGLLAYGPDPEHHPPWLGEALLLTVAVVVALAVTWTWRATAPRLDPARRRSLRGAVLLAVGVVLVFQAFRFHEYLDRVGLSPGPYALLQVGQTGAAVRWLLFGGLVSVAVVRDDALGLSLQTRRRIARVFVALCIIGGALTLATLGPQRLRAGVQELPGLALVLVGLALVISQGFRTLVDRAAHRLYGVPMPGDVAGRHDAYRLAALAALAKGGRPQDDEQLLRLREELDIDAATAAALERVAEASLDAPLAPGQVVAGRYRIRQLAGQGGAGRAFLARDELLARDVLVKEVVHIAKDRESPMLVEARAAGAVEHPGVVRVHDVVSRPGVSLLVEDYVPGGSLEQRIREHGSIPPREGLALMRSVLEALAAVHAAGIVHRDLKPANILLDAHGAPKLCDFGIATMRGGATIHASALGQGTPGFMAPEQARGEATTPASDVYAMGRVVRVSVRGPLPYAIEEVVRQALLPDPQARWRDASAMLEAWDEALRS